jgi:hypothetical protein
MRLYVKRRLPYSVKESGVTTLPASGMSLREARGLISFLGKELRREIELQL